MLCVVYVCIDLSNGCGHGHYVNNIINLLHDLLHFNDNRKKPISRIF